MIKGAHHTPKIEFDRSKSYGENLADAINKYWGAEVATGEGTSKYEGTVRMVSTYGIPKHVARNGLIKHKAIIRVTRAGHKWNIV